MDVKLGNWGGKGRTVDVAELARVSAEHRAKTGLGKRGIYDWSKADALLDSLWWMKPELPAIERIIWMKAAGVPLASLSLFVAAVADDKEWDKAKEWLVILTDEVHREYDYQAGQFVEETEKSWKPPEQWLSRYDKAVGDTLLAGFIKVETIIGELTSYRESSKKPDDRNSHDKWKREHPWENKGFALILAVLQAKYGGYDMPYNRAMCMLWWGGEIG